jgi:hypothetical protein
MPQKKISHKKAQKAQKYLLSRGAQEIPQEEWTPLMNNYFVLFAPFCG